MDVEEVLKLSAADLQDVPDPVAAEVRDCAAEESGGFFLPAGGSLPEAIKLLRKRLAEYGRKAGVEGPVLERLRVPPCPSVEPSASLQHLCAALEPRSVICNKPVSEDIQK
jgi:hypothetical protein